MKYIRPTTIEEAVNALQADCAQIKIIAGGTDLINHWRKGVAYPELLIDVSRIEALRKVTESNDQIFIGASVTFQDVVESDLLKTRAPLLHESCARVGVWQVRNRGTIGGNIANASPVADSVPPLVALEAQLHIADTNGISLRPIATFFKGPGKTELRSDQLIVGVSFKAQEQNEVFFHEKLGQRKAQCIAKVSVAFRACLQSDVFLDPKIIMGAVGPTYLSAPKAEQLLHGKKMSEPLLRQLIWLAADASTPITDLRSERTYRHDMVAALLYRHLSVHITA